MARRNRVAREHRVGGPSAALRMSAERATRALRATYRLQLTTEFGFEQARDLGPYLDRLGVSHIYSSPILMSRSGSTHGAHSRPPHRPDSVVRTRR